jgi:hypothetical protein
MQVIKKYSLSPKPGNTTIVGWVKNTVVPIIKQVVIDMYAAAVYGGSSLIFLRLIYPEAVNIGTQVAIKIDIALIVFVSSSWVYFFWEISTKTPQKAISRHNFWTVLIFSLSNIEPSNAIKRGTKFEKTETINRGRF